MRGVIRLRRSMPQETGAYIEMSRDHLRADCDNCFGLCCVALRFSVSDGFPTDKNAGQPCLNLQEDFRCAIHGSLGKRGLKGCIAFDCFGAGQKVSQISYGRQDWRSSPDSAPQMFKVFLIIMQLHELLWYLTEALTLEPARPLYDELRLMKDEINRLTFLDLDSLTELDVAEHRASVNGLLLHTSELVRAAAQSTQKVRLGQKERSGRRIAIGRGADLMGADLRRTNLRGANLRGAYLIAADLRETDLSGTDFIGADLRDADLRGADLSGSIFLTQAQINSAKCDARTKLPSSLKRIL